MSSGRSSDTLRDTVDEYKVFGDSVCIYVSRAHIQLTTGHGIVSKLKRRDVTDTVLMLLGIFIFLLVVLHILRKRLWNNNV